jgi:hypothetical protein
MRLGIPSCATKPVAIYAAALRNFTRPLRWKAREDVLQIGIRVMPVESRRLDQIHDRRCPFAAAQWLGLRLHAAWVLKKRTK